MKTQPLTYALPATLLLLTGLGIAGTAEAQTANETYELDRTEPRTVDARQAEYDRVERSRARFDSDVWDRRRASGKSRCRVRGSAIRTSKATRWV